MSRKTRIASAVGATALFVMIAGAAASGAYAREFLPGPDEQISTTPAYVSHEVVQPLPQDYQTADRQAAPASAVSLAALVDAMPVSGDLSREMGCLAGAIYFEARGEPLAGQLAVGNVVVNRAGSGRFPASYCGVVYQPSQFSFVRGGRMPAINTASAAWKQARAIATIAHDGLWDSPAQGALFFHAVSVQPRWNLQRVAQVHTHIFYR